MGNFQNFEFFILFSRITDKSGAYCSGDVVDRRFNFVHEFKKKFNERIRFLGEILTAHICANKYVFISSFTYDSISDSLFF